MQPLKLSKERTRNCICIHSTTKAGICKCGWGPFLKKDISVLKRVQRKAAWFCSQNYDRYASVADMIKDLRWATLEMRRRQSRLMLTCMYELTHGLIDIDTRVPYADKGVLKFSFFPKTIADWNCLPEAIASSSSLETFKYRLTAFLKNSYKLCSLI